MGYNKMGGGLSLPSNIMRNDNGAGVNPAPTNDNGV
jgi:hypothetical protein